MRYEGDIYRPPSEAYSLLVQVTIGCTHNKCTFCKMFKNKKFRVQEAGRSAGRSGVGKEHSISSVPRIFLCDGDAHGTFKCPTDADFETTSEKIFRNARECLFMAEEATSSRRRMRK